MEEKYKNPRKTKKLRHCMKLYEMTLKYFVFEGFTLDDIEILLTPYLWLLGLECWFRTLPFIYHDFNNKVSCLATLNDCRGSIFRDLKQ